MQVTKLMVRPRWSHPNIQVCGVSHMLVLVLVYRFVTLKLFNF